MVATTVVPVRFIASELAELAELGAALHRRYGGKAPSRSELIRIACAIVYELRDDPRVQATLDSLLEDA